MLSMSSRILAASFLPLRLLSLIGAAVLTTACALPSALSSSAADPKLRQAPFVLLGEVHDNPLHHAARAALLRELLADGRPTVVVFEQLGRAQDAAVAAAPREAQALIEAGQLDQKGWRWPLHKPVFEAALAGGAQVRGGNLEREQVRRVVREGAAAWPADLAALKTATPWAETQQQALLQDIEQGHCGAMPAAMLPGMALAQRSRDAAMAQALLQARAGGAQRVVLIAGNGHVRRDLAVPLYLQGAGVPAAEIVSWGYLEAGQQAGGRYDGVLQTAAAEREDPCKAFKR